MITPLENLRRNMETDNYKMEDVEVYMGVLAEKEEEPVKLPEISKEIYYALPADPEVTKPIELKTRNPETYTRVTPSNKDRLMKKAERIKKDGEADDHIIYLGLFYSPYDEEFTDEQDYYDGTYFELWSENIFIKIGMTKNTFDVRWKKHAYECKKIMSVSFSSYDWTRGEVAREEKNLIKLLREKGHKPFHAKVNTMGKCTETFHFNALEDCINGMRWLEHKVFTVTQDRLTAVL
jgi:hypothetical protein